MILDALIGAPGGNAWAERAMAAPTLSIKPGKAATSECGFRLRLRAG